MVSALHSESSGARSTLSGEIVFVVEQDTQFSQYFSPANGMNGYRRIFKLRIAPAMDRHPILVEVGHGHQETPRYGPDNMG